MRRSNSYLSSLSLCFLLFTSACLATRSEEFDRFNQCQLDSINALEPDHRVESEAGLTETWNPNHPELQCAGVSLIRRTIDPNGLHIPSFSPSPQLIFIVQGKGVLGLSIPGCPTTFEEQRQHFDNHQKIRRFSKGDIIAIPPGIPYWSYNNGDEPVVAITLLDTSNFANQLDSTPRVFYLGGNPEVEFPETQQQQQQQKRHSLPFPGGRKGGKNQQEEQNEGNSVLSGFSSEFLAQALNTDEDTAKKLQSPRDQRAQIVRVEGGLRIISPDLQDEEDEDEDEDEQEQGHSQREEEEDDDEDESHSHESRQKWRKYREEEKQGSHRREHKEEEEEEEEKICKKRSCRGKGRKNGLEETICSARIRENIIRPARADLYNPRAGRISTVNSLTLPILSYLRLSAEYVLLYRV